MDTHSLQRRPQRPAMLAPRQPLLFQPVESQTGFSFQAVVDEVRAVWFPEIRDEVEVRIVADGPLACISRQLMGRDSQVIAYHPVLNRPGTPIEFVRFIAKHELTHIVRPPRLEDGWREDHPREFWEHEAAVAPERYACWTWAYRELGRCLRSEYRGIRVVRTWRRRMAGWSQVRIRLTCPSTTYHGACSARREGRSCGCHRCGRGARRR